jgi:hypothetical protein
MCGALAIQFNANHLQFFMLPLLSYRQACLVALNDDAELVTMKILEDDLPEVLKRLDRSMARTAPIQPQAIHVPALVPVPEDLPPTPLAQKSLLADRKNIFDNDEFDVFNKPHQVDRSKIILGKKE